MPSMANRLWEIIDMGKEVYSQRKASGFKGYEKFNSWEEMIAKYDKERIDQDKKHVVPRTKGFRLAQHHNPLQLKGAATVTLSGSTIPTRTGWLL